MHNLQVWKNVWYNVKDFGILPPLPPMKILKTKHNLPKLPSYDYPAPSWFWSLLPSNLVQPATSMVNAEKLSSAAIQAGFPDSDTLHKV